MKNFIKGAKPGEAYASQNIYGPILREASVPMTSKASDEVILSMRYASHFGGFNSFSAPKEDKRSLFFWGGFLGHFWHFGQNDQFCSKFGDVKVKFDQIYRS